MAMLSYTVEVPSDVAYIKIKILCEERISSTFHWYVV